MLVIGINQHAHGCPAVIWIEIEEIHHTGSFLVFLVLNDEPQLLQVINIPVRFSNVFPHPSGLRYVIEMERGERDLKAYISSDGTVIGEKFED